jgi:large subunit ribosomal protein L17
MMHHRKGRKFGRESNARVALIRGLLLALIEQESIVTTEAKAKEIRPRIEKMVTKAMEDTLANKRIVLSRLYNNAKATKKIFAEIAPRFKDVAGGYTRIIKLGRRTGDASKMAVIEFIK